MFTLWRMVWKLASNWCFRIVCINIFDTLREEWQRNRPEEDGCISLNQNSTKILTNAIDFTIRPFQITNGSIEQLPLELTEKLLVVNIVVSRGILRWVNQRGTAVSSGMPNAEQNRANIMAKRWYANLFHINDCNNVQAWTIMVTVVCVLEQIVTTIEGQSLTYQYGGCMNCIQRGVISVICTCTKMAKFASFVNIITHCTEYTWPDVSPSSPTLTSLVTIKRSCTFSLARDN